MHVDKDTYCHTSRIKCTSLYICDKSLHQGLVKRVGIWTTCLISQLCAFITPEWSLSQVPLVPPVEQSRVKRLGRLPLSPPWCFYPCSPHHSQFRRKRSRLCACFITSIPLRLRRLYHVSSNSPRERHFSSQSGVPLQNHKRLWEELKSSMLDSRTWLKAWQIADVAKASDFAKVYDDFAGKLKERHHHNKIKSESCFNLGK